MILFASADGGGRPLPEKEDLPDEPGSLDEALERCRSYLRRIIYGFTLNEQDTEELMNDLYYKAIMTIGDPPPKNVKYELRVLARQLSINRVAENRAQKRGGGKEELVFSDLEDILDDKGEVSLDDRIVIRDVLNRFLESLSKNNRIIFLERYWFGESVNGIAEKHGTTQAKIASQLFRSRRKLKAMLVKEGFEL